MSCELFQIWDFVLLANLVIIKAAIISCTSTCDHVTGPYRPVHCLQPSGSTSTVHIASLFGAVDTRHYACNMDTVNCGKAFLQTEDFCLQLTIPGHARLCFCRCLLSLLQRTLFTGMGFLNLPIGVFYGKI